VWYRSGMSTATCTTCLTAKAPYNCKVCETPVCKKCAHFFSEEQIPYLPYQIPQDIRGGGAFCNACYNEKVAPVVDHYEATLARAREVFVFFVEESKETRLIRRSEKTFKVDGDDKDDIVLKLAFLAALAGFNAVVDIEVTGVKRRDGSYKLVSWSGSGTAAQVDAARHNR
jgi:hypothetical protein